MFKVYVATGIYFIIVCVVKSYETVVKSRIFKKKKK